MCKYARPRFPYLETVNYVELENPGPDCRIIISVPLQDGGGVLDSKNGFHKEDKFC